MKKQLISLFRKAFLRMDHGLHRTFTNSDGTNGAYPKYILPAEGAFLRWNNYFFGKRVFGALKKRIDTAIEENMPGIQPGERRRLEKDMVQSLLALEITPLEYCLFDFSHLPYSERTTYLSDAERWRVLHEIFGKEVRMDHADKWRFYQMAKPYFHREACKVGPGATKEEFMDFFSRHPRFFVKELTVVYEIVE